MMKGGGPLALARAAYDGTTGGLPPLVEVQGTSARGGKTSGRAHSKARRVVVYTQRGLLR